MKLNKRTLKISFGILGLAGLLIGITLQLERVQSHLLNRLLDKMLNNSTYQIQMKNIDISWFSGATIQNIIISDPKNDTLLHLDELNLTFSLINIFKNKYAHLHSLSIRKAHVQVIKKEQDFNFNLTKFISSLRDVSPKGLEELIIDELKIDNSEVFIYNAAGAANPSGINLNKMNWKISKLLIKNFELQHDTVQALISHLEAHDQISNLEIKNYHSNVFVTPYSLRLDDIRLHTANSYLLSDRFAIFNESQSEWSEITGNMGFYLNLVQSKISGKDINLLLGKDFPNELVAITGVISGESDYLEVDNIRIDVGEETFFEGQFIGSNMNDTSNAFFDIQLKSTYIRMKDIQPYIGEIPPYLDTLVDISFNGNIGGQVRNFIINGTLKSNVGSIKTNLNFYSLLSQKELTYKGNMIFQDVNLGAFYKNQYVGNIDLNAFIDGKGINAQNMNIGVDAQIYNLNINGYDYDTIYARGNVSNQLFKGNYEVRDPNCNLQGMAEVNLAKGKDLLKIDVNLDTLNFDELNLTSRDITVISKLNLDIDDLGTDNLNGNLLINATQIKVNDKILLVDSVRLIASATDSIRKIYFTMNGITCTVVGKFKVMDLLHDILELFALYKQKLMLGDYTINHQLSGQYYRLDFYARLDEISDFLSVLNLPFRFKGKTLLEASFKQGKNIGFSLFFETDSLEIGQSVLAKPTLEINAYSDNQISDVLTNFILTSEKQIITERFTTENLLIECVWKDNLLDIYTSLKQETTHSNINIKTNVYLDSQAISIKMVPSEIVVFDRNWNFNQSNEILLTWDGFNISDMTLRGDDGGVILIEGDWNKHAKSLVHLKSQNIQIEHVNVFSKHAIEGLLNTEFSILKNTNDEKVKFGGKFQIANIQYDDLPIGNINGFITWNDEQQRIYSNIEIVRENFKSIVSDGFYYPFDQKNQLDFAINFTQANLAIAKPLLKTIFSEINGYANGVLEVKGLINNPVVSGDYYVNGDLKLQYLNSTYTFDGQLAFKKQKIEFLDIRLEDRRGSVGTIGGYISHHFFDDYHTNIEIQMNDHELINTGQLEGSLPFYGNAFATSDMKIVGPLNDLNISANIKTEKGTRLYLPAIQTETGQFEDYISFKNFSDTNQIEKRVDDFQFFTFDLNVEVTPDAYFQLIFDEKTGNILRARGQGTVNIHFNKDNELAIFGNVSLQEGSYVFTVANLLNKSFELTPNSKITWYGDPYNAKIDVEAAYLLRASVEELKNKEDQDPALLANKIPLMVMLNLTGHIFSPHIGYDVKPQEQVERSDILNALFTGIKTNEQELRKQVISLLLLNKFSPKESFALDAENIGSNFGELLTNQLSYLISQLDENLEIDLDLVQLNEESFNALQLRLAYTFLNGRLRVSRVGSFEDNGNQNTSVLSSIAGDWSVEYSITPDGKLRIKVFSSPVGQQLTPGNDRQLQEKGVSIKFVQEFNDFMELLIKKRKPQT